MITLAFGSTPLSMPTVDKVKVIIYIYICTFLYVYSTIIYIRVNSNPFNRRLQRLRHSARCAIHDVYI